SKEYVPGFGGVVAERTWNSATGSLPKVTFHQRDHLGSLRLVTDATGAVVEAHDYYPFGGEMGPVGASSRRKFTGHERDEETGLDYMLARYYPASLGRFLSVDPGFDVQPEDPQSWNLYGYVRNNPVNATDPDGRLAAPWHFFISFFAARKEGFSIRQSLRLAWQSVKTDFKPGSQSTRASDTNVHAMKGERPDGTVQTNAEARECTERSKQENIKKNTVESVGDALHTAEDSATPRHRDHVWNGVGKGFLTHFAHDVLPGTSTIKEAYAASREVMRAVREQNGQPRLPEGGDQ
ncbi:MAG: RHS repeat-associated core domain-containing protein, partial [Candidatus Polarisedimenticolia bacterium]